MQQRWRGAAVAVYNAPRTTTVTACMRMIALVQAVGGPPARRGGAAVGAPAGFGCVAGGRRGSEASLRRTRGARQEEEGSVRTARGGGVATRAIGHGDRLGRRCRRRPVLSLGVAPPSAAGALSGASCRRPARSSQAVLELWAGGVCSGAPPVCPLAASEVHAERRPRCTHAAACAGPAVRRWRCPRALQRRPTGCVR